MSDFSVFRDRYFIQADFVLERPLHIGRGASLEPIGSDFPVIKNPEGLPIIPGSSVKGAVRSSMERILRTLAQQDYVINGHRLSACDPFGSQTERICNTPSEQLAERWGEQWRKDANQLQQAVMQETCTACRLMGSPWLGSKVYFKDLPLLNHEELFRLTEIRDGVGIDRDTGTAKARIKFDYEIVPAGARFLLEVWLETDEAWEAGLFLSVLRLWERGELALGGKTSRGLGRGRLERLRVEHASKERLLEYLLEDTRASVEVDGLIQTFTQQLSRRGGAEHAQGTS
jgi:CRISPR-associated RAMP protein (TIGR02581 family)